MTIWLWGHAWQGYRLWQGDDQSLQGAGRPAVTLMDQFVRSEHLSDAGNAFLLGTFLFVIGFYGFMVNVVDTPMNRRRENLLLRMADRLRELGEIEESTVPTPSPKGPTAQASG